jgi:hypothetical protein
MSEESRAVVLVVPVASGDLDRANALIPGSDPFGDRITHSSYKKLQVRPTRAARLN